jgi:hypothetical protein
MRLMQRQWLLLLLRKFGAHMADFNPFPGCSPLGPMGRTPKPEPVAMRGDECDGTAFQVVVML